MKRVLCVWLPRWSIQRFRHAHPALSERPLVLHAPARGGRLVVASCSPAASRAGVVPGMALAEARALATAAHFAPHEPRADREALRALAVWSQRFSPVVAVEEGEQPEGLLVDIIGCGHLFGGEQALAAKVVRDIRAGGYLARAAVADTAGAAWAVARHTVGPSGAAVVPPDGQMAALSPLAVEALRLPSKAVQLLQQLDVRRVGQLLALPRASLPSRFGTEVLLRLDQALGLTPELLAPEPAPEPTEASWSFEPSTADRRTVTAAVEFLLGQVLDRLRPLQLGVRRLWMALRIVGEEPVTVRVGLLQPSVSAPHLAGLVRLHAERVRIPAEVSAVTVRADEVAPLAFAQPLFFEDGPGADRWREFPALIDRMSNRLGERAVLRSRLRPDAQPEFAYRFEPWLGQGLPAPARSLSPAGDERLLTRPLCLKPQPVALPVAPGRGPPARFAWQGRDYGVARAWGPERIETGWWRGRDIRRDYYLVETTTGERFWLFRAGRGGHWFLHGTFG
jgi:protein ImuB